MLLQTQKIEPVAHSIVLLVEPTRMNPISLKELEAKLGTIDATERVMTADATGTVFRLARSHIEVVLTPNKWEINARGEEMTETVAASFAQAVEVFKGYLEKPTWKAIGYNYNIMFETLNNEFAARAIAKETLNISALEQRTKYPLKGAAVWLYSDNVESRKLWLRLEPRGGDSDSTKVWAYANISEEVKNGLPSQSQMATDFQHFHNIVIELIRSL